MGFVNTIHGGGAPSDTTSVYYTGSDTLLEGYTLCYDFNAADVNQENATQTSPNVGEECWADARRVLVEKCSEGNKLHFAGCVAACSDGVTGPGWVTIHRPGSICNVFADADCDHERSAGYNSGQILNVTVGQYYMSDAGWPGTGAAMVLQDVDRDTTNEKIMAQLMTGPPSGGYVYLSSLSLQVLTDATLSVLLSGDVTWAGEYEFAGIGSSAISATCGTADGKWDGQRFKIAITAVMSNTRFDKDALIVSSGFIPGLGTSLALASLLMAKGFSFTVGFSLAGDSITCQYDGGRWVVQSLGSTTTISCG